MLKLKFVLLLARMTFQFERENGLGWAIKRAALFVWYSLTQPIHIIDENEER